MALARLPFALAYTDQKSLTITSRLTDLKNQSPQNLPALLPWLVATGAVSIPICDYRGYCDITKQPHLQRIQLPALAGAKMSGRGCAKTIANGKSSPENMI
jgi:hypothetical protein